MFSAGSDAFANVIISDTSIADETTKVKATCFFRTAEGILSPLNVYNNHASLSRMFGNYYRVRVNRAGAELTGLFALLDTGKAQMILQSKKLDAEIHAVFVLEKMPASDTLNARDLVPSSWSLTGGGTATYNGRLLLVAASDDFTVSIDSRDADTASLTISGSLVSTTDSLTIREYNNETQPVRFEHAGYNTLYAEHESEAETHYVIFTLITSRYAVVSDAALTTGGNGISIIGNATKR